MTTFTKYDTAYEGYKEDPAFRSESKSARELYEGLSSKRLELPGRFPLPQQLCLAELSWEICGRPRYKVWPGMLEALTRTSLDIDASYFNMPFPAISIMLPKGMLKMPDGRSVEGVIAATVGIIRTVDVDDLIVTDPTPEEKAASTTVLSLAVQTETPDDIKVGKWFHFQIYMTMELTPGATLEQRFAERSSKTSEPSDYDAIEAMLFKLVIGTCFFAIGRHKYVTQDTPDALTRLKDERSAKRGRRPGSTFSLGREIIVPSGLANSRRPRAGSTRAAPEQAEGAENAETKKYELEFGHLRCGHLRWQQYGPKEGPNDYKLIFVEPTVVRPDLPMKASAATHVVKDSKPETRLSDALTGVVVDDVFERLNPIMDIEP